MSATTTRLGIVYPTLSDAADITGLNALVNKVDTLTPFSAGTSLPAQPVVSGTFFLNVTSKVLYVSDGSAWHSIGTNGGELPIGSLADYSGASDPVDQDGQGRWVIADGRALSRTTYARLWDLYRSGGSTSPHGNGNGSTTFNVPDARGRVSVGAGTGSTLTNRVLGAFGGAETHQLVANQLPPHGHGFADRQFPMVYNGSNNASWQRVNVSPGSGYTVAAQYLGATSDGIFGATGFTEASTTPAVAHNNMQPFIVTNKIVRIA